MRKLGVPLFSMLAAVLVSWFALGAGCSGTRDRDAQATEDRASVQVATVTVDELDHLLAGNECQAVDANGTETRRHLGVIPGAVLLTDADSIDKLPADKTRRLVFYCTNIACGASHHAATKAIMAGYSHVKVLPDGIAGWVKAGKKTTSI
jgi:rhodanese-related sulfurtransferase